MSIDADRPGRPRVARARWQALAALGALALLLHAGLLSRIDRAWVGSEPATAVGVPAAAAVLQTRSIDVPAAAEPVIATVSAPVVAAVSVRVVAPVAAPAAAPLPAPRRLARPALPATSTATAEQLPPAVAVEPVPIAGAADAVPVYRTRLPPAALLRYRLRRGTLHGTAELAWRPAGDHYRLQLDGRLDGLTLLTQISDGAFDAAGLAPQRFTDQRARRAVMAANFQRDAGTITFSGPSTALPLWPGVQDRLSWLIQLAAVVAAEPELAAPDGRVVLQVVGARADAAVWVLRYAAGDSLVLAGEPVPAARFVRDPGGPYDTAAEVWLDPHRHYLPVRATWRNGADAETLELVLQELVAPP